jgi:hypothetical protein
MRYGGLMGGTIGNHYAGPSGAAMGALMAGQAIGDAFRNMGRSVADRRDRDDRLQQQAQQDAFRQQQFDMMQQRYDAEQQQRERQNAMQDNTLKARGLLNGGLLSGDIGPHGRTPEEMQAKHGFNPLPYLTQEELNYRTPEQKIQDALGLYKQKLKAENEARPPVPKANLKLVEMDGPEGPGQYVVDLDTRAASFLGSVPQEPAAPDFKSERALAKEWSSENKQFDDVSYQFNVIEKAAQAGDAAGDIGLVFGIMKMFDPGSVVRESEFAVAQNAAGLPERLGVIYERLKSGERLTPAQRERFVDLARKLKVSTDDLYSRRMSHYKEIAGAYGMDPSRVVFDRRRRSDIGSTNGAQARSLPPLPDGAVLIEGQ